MKKNIEHYDFVAENYHLQYERETLFDLNSEYPANYFRVHLLLNSFIKSNIKKVVEVGVGEGTPLVSLSRSGFDVCGFDVSKEMIKKSKENFEKNGLDPNKIIYGDIEDPLTYTKILNDGKFDGLLAMGVMPHVEKDSYVLTNMKNMLNPGGKVFIEFRNKLFSFTSFNKYSYEFFMDDLYRDTKGDLREELSSFLKTKFNMNEPKPRLKLDENSEGVGYDGILSKFHNPFEVKALFKNLGFKDPKFLFYHYHPSIPSLEKDNPKEFRHQSISYEHEDSNWKGLFLCSAFVIEATVE